MAGNLIVGGDDTTSSQIGCTLLTLFRHPHLLDAVRDTPALLTSVVNETLRLEPTLSYTGRTLKEPMTFNGSDFDEGAIFMISLAAANRDPAVWHNPDAALADRFAQPDAPKLLSFGRGAHFCLGTALAMMTLEAVVKGVVARNFQAADNLDNITWRRVLGRSPTKINVRCMSK